MLTKGYYESLQMQENRDCGVGLCVWASMEWKLLAEQGRWVPGWALGAGAAMLP